ncbi:hypothetical protein Pelo_14407 [Pelomyxa schiedti]|nr:hypothetical protein Pelo_14407 [Pelomyxa schiedti]
MTSDRPNYVAGVGYSNPSCVEARGNMATDNLDMSDPELKTAFDQFTASEINWLLYGYVPKSNKLKLCECFFPLSSYIRYPFLTPLELQTLLELVFRKQPTKNSHHLFFTNSRKFG